MNKHGRLRRLGPMRLVAIVAVLALGGGVVWLLSEDTRPKADEEVALGPSPSRATTAPPPRAPGDAPDTRSEPTDTRQARDRGPGRDHPGVTAGSDPARQRSQPRSGGDQGSESSQRKEARHVLEDLLGLGRGNGDGARPPTTPPKVGQLLGGLDGGDRPPESPRQPDAGGLLGIGAEE